MLRFVTFVLVLGASLVVANDSPPKKAWSATIVGSNVLSYVAGRDAVIAMVGSTDPTTPPTVQGLNRSTGGVLWFHPTTRDRTWGRPHADDAFSDLALSPDGQFVVYTRCNPHENVSSVWVLNAVSGTFFNAGSVSASWSTPTRCKDAPPAVFHQDLMLVCLGQRVVTFFTKDVGSPIYNEKLGKSDDFCGTHIAVESNTTAGRAFIGAYDNAHPKLFAIGFDDRSWWYAWGGNSWFTFNETANYGSPRVSAGSGIVVTWLLGGERFHAVDASTGAALWQTKGNPCGIKSNQLISAIVDDSGVYLSSFVTTAGWTQQNENCVEKVSHRDPNGFHWAWVGMASEGNNANIMRPPVITAGSTSGHRAGLVIGVVGCQQSLSPSSPSMFAVDAETGTQVWGPIALNYGCSELLSPIAYHNETVYAALTYSQTPSITALTLPQPHRTVLYSYDDPFCKGNVTARQQYQGDGQCYKDTIGPKQASYRAVCGHDTSKGGLCLTAVAYGEDASCAAANATRPEAFPCNYCFHFLGHKHEMFSDCHTLAPTYNTDCNDDCSVCNTTMKMGAGVCRHLGITAPAYYSVQSVEKCQGIVTFENFFGSRCDGDKAYTQAVPVGMCMNGTRAECHP